MRIGLQIPSFTWPGGAAAIGPTLGRIAQTADDAGFATIWCMDHFFQIQHVGPAADPMLEGYSALAYMAALTKRVRLGLMVTGVIYRHPGVLVKTVTTLDVLSGGRATLGIGAAWNEVESRGLGIPFPPLKVRFEMLAEALEIAHLMFQDNTAPYYGKHYQLGEPINHPLPLSQPHPPILIGGGGEQKTLRLVAKYGDACNLFARMGPDVLTHKLDVLKQHCDDLGRPYDEIEKTALDTVKLGDGGQSAADVIAACRSLADLGFQQIIFNMPNVSDITPLETFGKEIIPAVAEF
ncbi:MAG: LLM class F420-dependent oxidoreductase [Anaerolineae bacterium]